MAQVQTGSAGIKIAQALGLDGERIRRLTIELNQDSIVTATVEFLPSSGQIEQIEGVLREYDFVERESPGIRSFDP